MYKILCRYEHWDPDGKTWTRWYDYTIGISSKAEAEKQLTALVGEEKKNKTNLKCEYKISET